MGWLLKVGVTRFGGSGAYRRSRPFFIGMIAGTMVIGIVWMVVGALYYVRIGSPPPPFLVHQ